MRKTITIEDDVYQLLRSLKRGRRDSFSDVILRHIHIPAKTNAELLDFYDSHPPPDVNWEILEQIAEGRRGRK